VSPGALFLWSKCRTYPDKCSRTPLNHDDFFGHRNQNWICRYATLLVLPEPPLHPSSRYSMYFLTCVKIWAYSSVLLACRDEQEDKAKRKPCEGLSFISHFSHSDNIRPFLSRTHIFHYGHLLFAPHRNETDT
jgi:hypothetical protein